MGGTNFQATAPVAAQQKARLARISSYLYAQTSAGVLVPRSYHHANEEITCQKSPGLPAVQSEEGQGESDCPLVALRAAAIGALVGPVLLIAHALSLLDEMSRRVRVARPVSGEARMANPTSSTRSATSRRPLARVASNVEKNAPFSPRPPTRTRQTRTPTAMARRMSVCRSSMTATFLSWS